MPCGDDTQRGGGNAGPAGSASLLPRVGVLLYWVLLVAVVVILQAHLVGASRASLTAVRKGYHVLAVLVMVPALAWDVPLLVVSDGACTGLGRAAAGGE